MDCIYILYFFQSGPQLSNMADAGPILDSLHGQGTIVALLAISIKALLAVIIILWRRMEKIEKAKEAINNELKQQLKENASQDMNYKQAVSQMAEMVSSIESKMRNAESDKTRSVLHELLSDIKTVRNG